MYVMQLVLCYRPKAIIDDQAIEIDQISGSSAFTNIGNLHPNSTKLGQICLKIAQNSFPSPCDTRTQILIINHYHRHWILYYTINNIIGMQHYL